MAFYTLPVNARIIEIVDRRQDASYVIEPGFIHIFPFVVPADDFMRTQTYQSDRRQNLSMRAWISDVPNDSELFFRFHPGTGGVTHMFYDRNMITPPTPVKSAIQRNLYSNIAFTPQDDLIALEPGIYYFNVMNMVLQESGYHLSFIE